MLFTSPLQSYFEKHLGQRCSLSYPGPDQSAYNIYQKSEELITYFLYLFGFSVINLGSVLIPESFGHYL